MGFFTSIRRSVSSANESETDVSSLKVVVVGGSLGGLAVLFACL